MAGQERHGHCLPQLSQRRPSAGQNVTRPQRMVPGFSGNFSLCCCFLFCCGPEAERNSADFLVFSTILIRVRFRIASKRQEDADRLCWSAVITRTGQTWFLSLRRQLHRHLQAEDSAAPYLKAASSSSRPLFVKRPTGPARPRVDKSIVTLVSLHLFPPRLAGGHCAGANCRRSNDSFKRETKLKSNRKVSVLWKRLFVDIRIDSPFVESVTESMHRQAGARKGGRIECVRTLCNWSTRRLSSSSPRGS